MNKKLYLEYLNESIEDNISTIDKLNTFLENALYDMELSTLLEDGSGDDKKAKATGKAVSKALKSAWNFLVELAKSLAEKIQVLVGYKDRVVMDKEIKISKYVIQKIPRFSMNDSNANEVLEEINTARTEQITLKPGAAVKLKGLQTKIFALHNSIKNINNQVNAEDVKMSSEKAEYFSALSDFYKVILSDCNRVVLKVGKTDKSNKINDNIKEKYIKRDKEGNPTSRIDDKVYNKVFRESAGLTRNEYIASIMLEAADILKEEGEGDLVNGATNLVDTDIKDIPNSFEEKPEVDDEYNPEIVGGDDGSDVDPEVEDHIKELCDGDKEVMDILTQSDGGGIIDGEDEPATDGEPSSSNESIEFWW